MVILSDPSARIWSDDKPFINLPPSETNPPNHEIVYVCVCLIVYVLHSAPWYLIKSYNKGYSI